MARPAMPSRERYGDVLQLRPDLWRVPLVMCLATLLFFLITVEVDWAAAQRQLTLPRWLSVGGEQVEVVWEATAADALVKADRTDVEAAYRRAREALVEH
jgi:hypothetical protein